MIALRVAGMTCAHCVRAVTDAIKAADPTASVVVDLASGSVQVATALGREAVAAAIVSEGYKVNA